MPILINLEGHFLLVDFFNCFTSFLLEKNDRMEVT